MDPCPFCGNRPHLVIPPGSDGWRVECQTKGCIGPRTWGQDRKHQATNLWAKMIRRFNKAQEELKGAVYALLPDQGD